MGYFSTRNGIKVVNEESLYERFVALVDDFMDRSFFKENLDMPRSYDHLMGGLSSIPLNKKSRARIGIIIYPLNEWDITNRNKETIFDAIEFLYQFVSEPGEWGNINTNTGWNMEGYLNYDEIKGKEVFRNEMNDLLEAFGEGYKLQVNGEILYVGDDTVNFLNTDFPEYDISNIDSKIYSAIKWWKGRNQTIEDKKKAVLELAGVLEFLKKDVKEILHTKDTSDLFEIANRYGIRHHNLHQKTDYDQHLWYDWVFQNYLNTCIMRIKG